MKHFTERQIAKFRALINKISLEDVAYILLFALGFKGRHNGTLYLADAIFLICTHNHVSVTKDVYPAVAEKYDSTPAGVERCIRRAITESYESGKLVRLNDLLGDQMLETEYPPTNSDFLAAVYTLFLLNGA